MFAKKIRVTFRVFALKLRLRVRFRWFLLAVRMFATRIGFFSQPELSSQLFGSGLAKLHPEEKELTHRSDSSA
jgi:hypothetical protein